MDIAKSKKPNSKGYIPCDSNYMTLWKTMVTVKKISSCKNSGRGKERRIVRTRDCQGSESIVCGTVMVDTYH